MEQYHARSVMPHAPQTSNKLLTSCHEFDNEVIKFGNTARGRAAIKAAAYSTVDRDEIETWVQSDAQSYSQYIISNT